MMKFVPTTIFYQGRDYEGGLMQEVPDELARLIDEYTEKNKKELERLQELSYVAVSADVAMANDPNFQMPEEEVIQYQKQMDILESPPKRRPKAEQEA